MTNGGKGMSFLSGRLLFVAVLVGCLVIFVSGLPAQAVTRFARNFSATFNFTTTFDESGSKGPTWVVANDILTSSHSSGGSGNSNSVRTIRVAQLVANHRHQVKVKIRIDNNGGHYWFEVGAAAGDVTAPTANNWGTNNYMFAKWAHDGGLNGVTTGGAWVEVTSPDITVESNGFLTIAFKHGGYNAQSVYIDDLRVIDIDEANQLPANSTVSLSSGTLQADGNTQYTLTLSVTDPNRVADIRSMRVILDKHSNPDWGRGYLSWGKSDDDILHFGGNWSIASATGGGKWGFLTNGWGNQYITPVSASTTTSGNTRSVTWTFKVQSLWAVDGPLTGNYVGMFSEDYDGNTNWQTSDQAPWNLTFVVQSACTPPSITTHPVNQSKIVGESVTFVVAASGTAPLSYQWKKNGADISGATQANYTINALTTGDAGSYTCQVSNYCGSATSNAAALTVTAATGSIRGKVQDDSGACVSGASVTFNGENSVTTTSDCSIANYTRELAAGVYTVAVSKEGYKSVSQSGKSVTVGSTTAVDFTGANALVRNSLSGVVKDSSGNGLSARVVARNTATGTEYAATSDASGNYQIVTGSIPFPVGTYTVTASKDGYSSVTQSAITVAAGANTLHFQGSSGLVFTGNMIGNADFEQGFSTATFPSQLSGLIGSGWTGWADGWTSSAILSDERGVVHGNVHSQKLSTTHGSWGIYRLCTVVPDTYYDVSAWVYPTGSGGWWSEIGIRLGSSTDWKKFESEPDGWRQRRVTISSGSNENLGVYFKCGTTSGSCTIYCDDVSVSPSSVISVADPASNAGNCAFTVTWKSSTSALSNEASLDYQTYYSTTGTLYYRSVGATTWIAVPSTNAREVGTLNTIHRADVTVSGPGTYEYYCASTKAGFVALIWGSETSAFGSVTVSCAAPPNAPTNPSAGNITTDSLRWEWVDNSTDETGFRVYAGAGATAPGTATHTTAPDVTFWDFSGLSANTQYSFQVAAVGASGESAKTDNLSRYTLAVAPAFGASGDGRIDCDKGAGSASAWYAGGTKFTFTAVNGFGTGTAKASKYRYVWNSSADTVDWVGASEWTSGALELTPAATGVYYLHVQAANGDGAYNDTALHLGPYNIDATAPANVDAITEAIAASGEWTNNNSPVFGWSGAIDDDSGIGQYWVSFADADGQPHSMCVNGGFEVDTAVGWTEWRASGWGDPLTYVYNDTTGGPTGNYDLKMYNGYGSGGVYQQFATVPGQAYRVSGKWKGAGSNDWYEVLLIDGPFSLIDADGTNAAANIIYKHNGVPYGNMPAEWEELESLNGTVSDANNTNGVRTASGTTMTLVLKCGSTAGGATVYFDNIALYPVPVSASWTPPSLATDGSQDGERLLNVRAQDNAGNLSDWTTAPVTFVHRYDSQPPSAPGTPVDAGDFIDSGNIVFDWTAAADATSGVASYNVQIGTTPGGSDVFAGAVGMVLTTGITVTSGGTYYCRVQAVDAAGNVGPWSESSDGVMVDTVAPSGIVTINNNTAFTNSRTVILTLSASDLGSGVVLMRLSDDGIDWTAWEPYATNRNWTLSKGDGIKTVYAQFADAAGNVSEPASDHIALDTTPPTAFTPVADPADWTNSDVSIAFETADIGSGIDRYEVSLDGISFASAASPYIVSTEGDTLVTIRAFDMAGNTTDASVRAKIDRTAPVAGTASSPSTARTSPIIVAYSDASDSGSGLKQVSLWFKKDSGAWTDSGLSSTAESGSFYFVPVGDGTYYFDLVAEDNAGNASAAITGEGDCSTVYDATAPVVNINSVEQDGVDLTDPLDPVNALQGEVNIEFTVQETNLTSLPVITITDSDNNAITLGEVRQVDDVYQVTAVVDSFTANGPAVIEVTATDDAGSTGTAVTSINVNKSQARFELELTGLVAKTVERWIMFKFGGDGSGSAEPWVVHLPVTFTSGVADVRITDISNEGLWTRLSIKDKLHTLRTTIDLTDTGGRQYAPYNTSRVIVESGDLTGDNLIDILDFGVFIGQYGRELPPAGLDWIGRHADLSGNGTVGTDDFSVLFSGFLTRGDTDCGNVAIAAAATGGRTSVTVQELRKAGVEDAERADLNYDGMVDTKDVSLFLKSLSNRGR